MWNDSHNEKIIQLWNKKLKKPQKLLRFFLKFTICSMFLQMYSFDWSEIYRAFFRHICRLDQFEYIL